MKRIATLFTILFVVLQSNAQDSTQVDLIDSVRAKKTIAVVPFEDRVYFNHLSMLWYQTGETRSQEEQISDISKYLAEYLADSLILDYDLIDLSQSQTISTTDFLREFYMLGGIAFADTVPQKESKLKWVKKKLAKEDKNKEEERRGEVQRPKQDRTHQFLNFIIRDTRRYRQLCKELEVDEVLFINQFDVKGDFGSPYNSGRETDYFINIHYALYDKNANLILGNKTKYATTNEKARYTYFLKNDLEVASMEITRNISNLNKAIAEEEAKQAAKEAKKKKKQ